MWPFSDTDDKWQQLYDGPVETWNEVHHIEKHEVRYIDIPTWESNVYCCWRCEKEFHSVAEFKSVECHNCDCGYCPK